MIINQLFSPSEKPNRPTFVIAAEQLDKPVFYNIRIQMSSSLLEDSFSRNIIEFWIMNRVMETSTTDMIAGFSLGKMHIVP